MPCVRRLRATAICCARTACAVVDDEELRDALAAGATRTDRATPDRPRLRGGRPRQHRRRRGGRCLVSSHDRGARRYLKAVDDSLPNRAVRCAAGVPETFAIADLAASADLGEEVAADAWKKWGSTAVYLTVIGCAGSAPAPDSACSCYLIEADYRGSCSTWARAPPAPALARRPSDDRRADPLARTLRPPRRHHPTVAAAAVSSAPPLPITGPSNMPAVLTENRRTHRDRRVQGRPPSGRSKSAWRKSNTANAGATRIGDALCYTADTGPCAAIDELAAGARVLLGRGLGLRRRRAVGRPLLGRGRGAARRPVGGSAADPHSPARLAGSRTAAGRGGGGSRLPGDPGPSRVTRGALASDRCRGLASPRVRPPP